MTTAGRIIVWLDARGARLKAKDGRLVYDGPEALLTDELAERLRAHRAELVGWLEAPWHELMEDLVALGFAPDLVVNGRSAHDMSGVCDVVTFGSHV